MTPFRSIPSVAILALSLLMGCGSVSEVNVAAPRPAATDSSATATTRASLTLDLESGTQALPEGVSSTRFRVREVWMKARGDEWTKRLAATEPFVVDGANPVQRTLLSTAIPAQRFDSLALVLDDVYIEYGPNAGGRPDVAGTNPVKLAARFTPSADQLNTLLLRYEAATSVARDSTGRWSFRPDIFLIRTVP